MPQVLSHNPRQLSATAPICPTASHFVPHPHHEHPTPSTPASAAVESLEPRALFSAVFLSSATPSPDPAPTQTAPQHAQGSLYTGSRGDSNILSE